MAIKKLPDSNSKNKNLNKEKKAITIKKEVKKTKDIKDPKTKISSKRTIKLEKVSPSKKKKKNKSKLINNILSLLMLCGISVMILLMAFCTYIVISAPPFETDKLYSREASILYDKNGNEFARVGTEQRELKTYEELPQTFIDALVATEDSRFFQHNGFDVIRFIKASLGQLSGNSSAGGASTLTMQVAKNTFSKQENGNIASKGAKGIIRKFTDIYMSIFLIERNYTKEEIIEFYANSQELGFNAFGVEQAAQTYFGKSISDLSLTESALLVGLFNGPSYYNPYKYEDRATNRRAIVLDLMVRHGYITEEQAEDAKAIPVSSLLAEQKTETMNKYQQFLDLVLDEVEDDTGFNPYTTSMEIYTTLDPELQQYMTDLNEGNLGYKWKVYKYNDYRDVVQIAAIVTDVHDGSIAAVNNGRHQNAARQLTRATSKFQPGSTAKPMFAYGPYIEYNNGNTGTLFFDNKMTYSNGQELTNANKDYKGAMTMRQALVESRNIPAVQAFQAVDKNKISEFVHNLGIDYCKYNSQGQAIDCNLYEAYAIGGGLEMSPKEMAAAYGAFARGGYYIEPYSYTKIIYKETDEVKENKKDKIQAMSAETAYMITDMLISATKNGVGGSINVSGTEIASKTGTATYDTSFMRKVGIPDSSSAANWVVTYSPDYVIAFWYGVDYVADNKTYTNAIDAAIERKKISAILANKIYKKNSKFSKLSGVISASYELETKPAQIPSSYTPADLISRELFKKGTEPSEVSERFEQLRNPTNGSADVTGNQINLSWDEIAIPDAINPTYLKNYFNDNYGQFASIYLDKRNTYNTNNIGTVGYQIYLDNNGTLQPLGYTPNTYFIYNAPSDGTYKFVIKSSYSIFKANMSSGLNIQVDIKNSSIPELPGENEDQDEKE